MLLADIVVTSARVAETRARLAKIALLRDCLRRLSPQETQIGAAFLTGRPRQGRIGVGPALVRRLFDASPAPQPRLTLIEVDAALALLDTVAGAGALARRGEILGALGARATAAEQRFLARLLLGELRQGALEGVMVEALAQAASLPVAEVRRAVMVAGELPEVARAALARGREGLDAFRVQVMQPVQPMLADAAQDVGDALDRLGTAALEYKLDGARVQVHKADDEVRVFTRRLNDVTAAVPELVEAVRGLRVRSLILDGEALALRSDATPQPFQITMRRFGRRLNVAALRRELPLTSFYFDLLHLDGEDWTGRSAAQRWEALVATLPGALRIPRRVTGDAEAARAFVRDALAHGHEGVMAKDLRAPYQAGSRGSAWLKVKPVHTLDLVVLAAEWGSGRRRGWLSNLHLGARDPQGEGFVMLGKTFKGLTDQMLRWQTERLLQLELGRDEYTVYVRPELVVEVAFNDIQASPHYPGGLALRFARVRAHRPDKTADQADTIDRVRHIYAAQRGRSDSHPGGFPVGG